MPEKWREKNSIGNLCPFSRSNKFMFENLAVTVDSPNHVRRSTNARISEANVLYRRLSFRYTQYA